MGKASRRQRGSDTGTRRSRPGPVPFVRRPFEGLVGETDWVALREILPAATAVVTVRPEHVPDGAPGTVTVATVLPMAWPGLHRSDGTVLIGTQSGNSSGDASRDLAAQLLAALAAEPGSPVVTTEQVTADSPRLQDVLAADSTFDVTVHEGFDFWVEGQELEGDAAASLERANETVVPTTAMTALPSAYWVRIGERAHIRLVLPDDEDAATDALSRLHAAGDDGLGGDSRLLGAFRACGLLVPVWDLDPGLEPGDHEDELAAWGERYAAALASDAPLGADERRARAGLLSRQVTLR
ncbi:DUF5926 family protein [Fodinibacter luteus]|uniref:DUF5926 family protein n=1 Tax=Fodinibacter luteus TaxID=552064 RepID=A0ABP8KD81_9MICO